jgi:hypothetical protein
MQKSNEYKYLKYKSKYIDLKKQLTKNKKKIYLKGGNNNTKKDNNKVVKEKKNKI